MVHTRPPQSPLVFKHLSHRGTKACALGWKQSVSMVCIQEVTACFTWASVTNRLPARSFLWNPKSREITGPHTSNQTCDWLRRYSWEVIDRCAYSPAIPILYISMMTTWKSGVYHLLPTCRVYVEVRIKFLVSESSLR